MVIITESKKYTMNEYLTLESQADLRHEYLNGEIREMAGGTTNHNEIITNLCVMLKPKLRQANYRLFTENVRVWIEKYQVYTYPDLMIIAGDPLYFGEGKTTVINPCLIVEVASESTKNYDKAEKFDFYRGLHSLQEYIIIEQSKFQALQYNKQSNNQWLLTEYQVEYSRLSLGILSLEIELNQVYEGVEF